MGHDTLTVRIWRGPALQERTRVFIPANTGPAALADKRGKDEKGHVKCPDAATPAVCHCVTLQQTSTDQFLFF